MPEGTAITSCPNQRNTPAGSLDVRCPFGRTHHRPQQALRVRMKTAALWSDWRVSDGRRQGMRCRKAHRLASARLARSTAYGASGFLLPTDLIAATIARQDLPQRIRDEAAAGQHRPAIHEGIWRARRDLDALHQPSSLKVWRNSSRGSWPPSPTTGRDVRIPFELPIRGNGSPACVGVPALGSGQGLDGPRLAGRRLRFRWRSSSRRPRRHPRSRRSPRLTV